MKSNFRFVDGYALASGDIWVDLHNDFDFVGVDVSWAERLLTLSWRRGSGDWISKAVPTFIHLEFFDVDYLLLVRAGIGSDAETILAAGYKRSEAPPDEQGFLPDLVRHDDHIVLLWEDGSFLRIHAASAQITLK